MRKFFALFLVFSFLSASDTCMGNKHMRVGTRYKGPEGVGYKKGYATVEAFFAPSQFWGDSWLPFIDFRGHTFGMEKLALNAGFGLRYLRTSNVFGFNTYYDYRKNPSIYLQQPRTSTSSYNKTKDSRVQFQQIGAGFEVLGKVWDFRINGYLPFGLKQSTLYNAGFDSFQGHAFLIRGKREYVFKGADAEIGLHVDSIKRAPLYFAAGPYYLNGKGDSAWGGQFRAGVELFHRHVRLEGNLSYDHHFKLIGQGLIGLNISFGGKCPLPKKPCVSCPKLKTLETRAIQPVERREIIPISRRSEVRAAHNSQGDPWVLWFVDNTSSSAGTFESPYPTLAEAEASSSIGEMIYVFPGDGTTTGLDTGINLKDGQLLLSAAVEHVIPTSKGPIFISPQAFNLPKITAPSGTNIVTLANDNEVSGFYLLKTTDGNFISGTGSANFTSEQNTFDLTEPGATGIFLSNPSGSFLVRDSSFSALGLGLFDTPISGVFVELDSGAQLSNLDITNTDFGTSFDLSGFSGIGAILENSSRIGTFDISGSSVSQGGIFVSLETGSSIGTANLNRNSLTELSFDITDVLGGINIDLGTGTEIGTLNLSGNSFTGILTQSMSTPLSGIAVSAGNGSIPTVNVNNNTFVFDSSDELGIGFNLASLEPSGSIQNLNFNNNTFAFNGVESEVGIQIALSGGTLNNLKIENQTFGPTQEGVPIFITPKGGTIANVDIIKNTFDTLSDGSVGVFVGDFSDGSIGNLNAEKNTFKSIEKGSGFFLHEASGTGSIMSASFQKNTFEKIGFSVLVMDPSSVGIKLDFTEPLNITNLSMESNHFDEILEYGNAIDMSLNKGSIGTANIHLNDFSSAASLFGTSGIIHLGSLGASGSIGTLNIVGNDFSLQGTASQIGVSILPFASEGSITTLLNISNNQFRNGTNPIIISQSGGKIENINLNNNQFKEISKSGILLDDLSGGEIFKLNIKDNSFDTELILGNAIEIKNSRAGILNANISSNTFGEIQSGSKGIVITLGSHDPNEFIDSLEISSNKFNDNIHGHGIDINILDGFINELFEISGNTFTSVLGKGIEASISGGLFDADLDIINNKFDIVGGEPIFGIVGVNVTFIGDDNNYSNLNILRNTFSKVDGATAVKIKPDTVPFIKVSDNQFNLIQGGPGRGIDYISTKNGAVDISNNRFTEGASVSPYYGVSFQSSPPDSTCLKFANNKVTNSSGISAYLLQSDGKLQLTGDSSGNFPEPTKLDVSATTCSQ